MCTCSVHCQKLAQHGEPNTLPPNMRYSMCDGDGDEVVRMMVMVLMIMATGEVDGVGCEVLI